MDVKEFFFALAKECEEGKCEGCGAQDFCYTAPGSMTADLIERTINQMGLAEENKARIRRIKERTGSRWAVS